MAQQNERNLICPITIMLDGPTSYHALSQNMTIFFKDCKLWKYVTGLIPKPVLNPKSKATTAEESSKIAVTSDD